MLLFFIPHKSVKVKTGYHHCKLESEQLLPRQPWGGGRGGPGTAKIRQTHKYQVWRSPHTPGVLVEIKNCSLLISCDFGWQLVCSWTSSLISWHVPFPSKTSDTPPSHTHSSDRWPKNNCCGSEVRRTLFRTVFPCRTFLLLKCICIHTQPVLSHRIRRSCCLSNTNRNEGRHACPHPKPSADPHTVCQPTLHVFIAVTNTHDPRLQVG